MIILTIELKKLLLLIIIIVIYIFNNVKVIISQSNTVYLKNNNNNRVGTCYRRIYDKKIACTPDVIFIGASKSGTTSLAYYLQSHPLIMNINQYDADSKEGKINNICIIIKKK